MFARIRSSGLRETVSTVDNVGSLESPRRVAASADTTLKACLIVTVPRRIRYDSSGGRDATALSRSAPESLTPFRYRERGIRPERRQVEIFRPRLLAVSRCGADRRSGMASRRENDGFPSPSSSSSAGSQRSAGAIDETEKTSRGSGLEPARETSEPRPRDGTDHPTGSDHPRREENPFSFKHFLNTDTRSNYSMGGARPKIYSPVSPSPDGSVVGNREMEPVYSRNPTELPDFVQDHLVMEQCYLGDEAASSVPLVVADIENLPDFALNSVEQCVKSGGVGHVDGYKRRRARMASREHGRPKELIVQQSEPPRSVQDFPFDLPLRTPEARGSLAACPTSNSPAGKPGVNKSLPDFLNDGPIRNRVAGSAGGPGENLDLPERSEASLLSENERLRDQLNIARRHIAERTRMIESLKVELASRRAVDNEENAHLEKAMEQVEVNLIQSTKRATSAENAVALLKHEVKALTAEVAMLRSENRKLASTPGAGGGADSRASSTERKMKKLSDELRSAATSAEVSLRQLMSGVNNLKVLANAIENVDRIEERTKDFLPDFEEDNAAGPTL